MVTVDDISERALALPDVEEGTHFRLPAFKVRDKAFVLIESGETSVLLSVDPDSARAAVELDADTFEEVWRNDGSIFVGVRVQLASADSDRVADLVSAAWRHKAPKRLVETHFGS